ncbi:HipA N-terminal domain-containing protein [Escherichia coli]|nr:HipA N-terminal domain-containing protein [Escherichia coli]
MPKLVTWMNNQRVGELTKLANGAHTFKYAPEWLASRYARPLSLAMGLNASKGKKTAIDKIYPRHFLATAKVLKFPQVQMHEILSDFARMIPAALDNVKTSLPTDFPENVVTAVETNVLRLHRRLSREWY